MLPPNWVDRIFGKLSVTYGQRFLGLYAGLDLDAVKADWGNELGGYVAKPEAIAYALQHLPSDHPPTCLQFRELCRRAPSAQPPRLEGPPTKDNPALRQAMTAMAAAAKHDPKAWAHALREREIWQAKNPREVGKHERMTLAQRRMWRAALGLPENAPAERQLEETN